MGTIDRTKGRNTKWKTYFNSLGIENESKFVNNLIFLDLIFFSFLIYSNYIFLFLFYYQVQFNDLAVSSKGASAISPSIESEPEDLHQIAKMSIDVTSSVRIIDYNSY